MKYIMNIKSGIYDQAASLYQDGYAGKALEALGPLLSTCPGDAALLNLAGACCHVLNRKVEAAKYWEQALLTQPENGAAWCNLGVVLGELGRVAESEVALRRALEIDPGSPEANSNYGNLLRHRGCLNEAEAAYRRALLANPQFANAYQNLGAVLRELGQHAGSEVAYRQAIVHSPHSSMAHNGLGLLLHDLGRPVEAEAAFRQALAIAPDFARAHANLGRLLYERSRYDEAAIAARRAAELDPGLADAHLVLGGVLAAQNAGDIGPSTNAYRRAVELDPDNLSAHSNLVYTMLFESDDDHAVLEECRRLASHFEAPYPVWQVSYAHSREPQRRLRVGYVSPDFRSHCQSFFTVPLLTHHDPRAVEIYCYSGVDRPDEVTRQIRNLVDVWRDIRTLSDDALATMIMDDRIDILVDLTMHMAGGRPLLFARRPAPVQVAWLAYPGTTGSSAIDYRLTDPWLDPPGVPDADERYSERSIRLPDTFWCYDPLTGSPPVSPLPADRSGAITFGCLNSPRKLTDRTFRLWAQVLTRVAGSTMMLLVAKGAAREAVSAKFRMLGVDPSRLVFVDYQSRADYLETYRQIDIALDTFPYNGHTTSLDSFWMGVPVITAIGRTPVSRAGYALLANLGLPELAAASEAEFVDTAVHLAGDRQYLRVLRSGLRQRMERSPLMDGGRFARGIEAAYRTMWRAWCQRD